MMYLAAPFFRPSQIETVKKLEAEIEAAGFDLISPRRIGVLSTMTDKDRAQSGRGIFLQNCNDLARAISVLAVIDDRDPGTVWEMGFFYGIHSTIRPIYTYTDHDYGVNIMLAGCVKGHAKGVVQVRAMLKAIKNNESLESFQPNKEKVF